MRSPQPGRHTGAVERRHEHRLRAWRQRRGHREQLRAAWPGWSGDWTPPTVVVVMGEWGGTGLWNRSPFEYRDWSADDYVLEPELLGVSARLAARLTDWNERFGDGTAAWRDEGWAIARDLQREFDARDLAVEVLVHGGRGEGTPVRDRPWRS